MAELGGGKERLVAEHVGSVGQAEARSSPAHFLDNSVPVLQREWRRPCPPLPLLELARGNGAARSGSEGGGSHGRVSNAVGHSGADLATTTSSHLWLPLGRSSSIVVKETDDDGVGEGSGGSVVQDHWIHLHGGKGQGRWRWTRWVQWQRCLGLRVYFHGGEDEAWQR